MEQSVPSEVKWSVSFLIGAALIYVGWKFFFFLVTLHVAVCLVLIIVILLQSGEAADLAGAFGGSGSQTAFGPRGAATLLSRATTWCAVMFMITSMLLVVRQDNTVASHSVFDKLGKPASSAPAPAKPAPLPVTPPTTPPPTNK